MLKQFPLQLGEAEAAASCFDIVNLDIINGGPRYCYNLTVSVSFRVSLLFARRPGQRNRHVSLETLVHTNYPT